MAKRYLVTIASRDKDGKPSWVQIGEFCKSTTALNKVIYSAKSVTNYPFTVYTVTYDKYGNYRGMSSDTYTRSNQKIAHRDEAELPKGVKLPPFE